MRGRTVLITLIIILLILSSVSCTEPDDITIAFYLYGEENVTVNYGSTYIDEGAYLNIDGVELSQDIKVNNTLDTNKLGTYPIDYIYNEMIITRNVTVADTSPPAITLNDDKIKYINANDIFVYPDFTAIDNYDGDITHLVEATDDIISDTEGEYKVVYTVTDSSGNSASIEQTIIVEDSMLTSSADEFSLGGMYPDTILREVILTEEEKAKYIDETIFIGDSRSCYFIWYGFISSANGWGRQSLTPLNIDTMKINKFFTKEEDTAINLIQDFQPARIIITMGVDCVGSTDPEVLVKEYKKFIELVQITSPDTLIVVNNLLPVDGSLDNENSEIFLPSNEKVNKANYYLAQMCDEIGVRYLDSAPVLKDENGLGKAEYFVDDNVHLTKEGQKLVFDYIISHPYIK